MMPLNVEVDLTELVERVAFRFALLGRGRGIEVVSARPDDSVLVNCDPYAAERALVILYTTRSCTKREWERRSRSGGRRREFRAACESDDGPGVAPDELALLSERTFRSDDARQRDSRGMDLALTTYEIARRANWQLEFAVLEPHGLEVTLWSDCLARVRRLEFEEMESSPEALAAVRAVSCEGDGEGSV